MLAGEDVLTVLPGEWLIHTANPIAHFVDRGRFQMSPAPHFALTALQEDIKRER